MPTKPTDRILDWASGGTTADPGGAKEAAGWLAADRPPANWWNWILNSFGQWLTWTESEIDEIPATVRTRVLGAMNSVGASNDTPVITSTETSVGIDTPQSGDVTSTTITVRFITAFANNDYTAIVTNGGGSSSNHFLVFTKNTTSMSVAVHRVSDGATVNPLTTSVKFFMDIKGAI